MSGKIKNAKRIEVDGVKYRSVLESKCASILKDNEIPFKYEEVKFELIPKVDFKNTIAFYPKASGKVKPMEPHINMRPKTYVPDFVIDTYKENVTFYIECKGFMNDDFISKKKMFLLLLEGMNANTDMVSVYLEPHNKQHILECIKIIKNYESSTERSAQSIGQWICL